MVRIQVVTFDFDFDFDFALFWLALPGQHSIDSPLISAIMQKAD